MLVLFPGLTRNVMPTLLSASILASPVQDSERQDFSFTDSTNLANSRMVSNLSFSYWWNSPYFCHGEACNLLLLPHNRQLHPLPNKLLLAAWTFLENLLQVEAFLNKQLTLFVPVERLGQKSSTKQFGKSELAGVIRGISIHFMHLLRK